MMEQYLRLKTAHPDAILFFHLGDFYEAFFDDAKILSSELDVVLTARNGTPMAGVPIRRGETYVNKLLKRGYKVAICQQVEDPRKATGLVKREVVRVMTPGTTIDEGTLDAGKNNYLCALSSTEKKHGLAALDLSTGEFTCTDSSDIAELTDEICRLTPSELLVPEGMPDPVGDAIPSILITSLSPEAFGATSVVGANLGLSEQELQAAGAILSYVEQTQKRTVEHIRPLQAYSLRDHMDLDPFTLSSLELVKPLREGQERGTLLHVLDHTVTSMGRRRLRRAILAPLADRVKIEARLDAVEALTKDDMLIEELQSLIRDVHDLERLIGKLGASRIRPLDLLLLQKTLKQVPLVAQKLASYSGSADLLDTVKEDLASDKVTPLCENLGEMLVEEPPVDARDGGLIRDGYDEELDKLHNEERALRAQIANLESTERERTGISSLKVGYNRVFGYYIEITKTHLNDVPPEYARRQTLANAERFITNELKGYEERISFVKEHALSLEIELFERALKSLASEIPLLQSIANSLSQLDFLLSLASVARHNAYTRPLFTEKHKISIRGGRHPVVEQVEEFVPNDLVLDQDKDLVILTGPNMAGKCLVEDTLVFTNQGVKPLSALRPPASRADTFTELEEIAVRGQAGITHASHFYDGGFSPVLRIHTRLGFELTGTPAHRLWIRNVDGTEGWKSIAEISSGDVVALEQKSDLWGNRLRVPNSVPDISPRAKRYRLPNQLTSDLAYLFGLLIGDGSLTGRNVVRFSTGDTFLGEEFKRIVFEQFGYQAGFTTKEGTDARGWYVTSQQIRAHLAQLGLGYAGAQNKSVPWSVLQAPRDIVVAFLQGLFDTDGSADKRYGNLELSTASATLSHQVQMLLLNLGIVSTRRVKQTSRLPAFRMSIRGEAALVFYDKIGFRLKRKQARRRFASAIRRPNIGGIPHLAPTLKKIQERIVSITNKPVTLKHVKRINSIFYTYVPNGRNPSYSKLAELASYCQQNGVPCEEIDTLLRNRYFYDSVESVEPAGIKQVYDLSVPDGNAYVAAGFVSHNSVYLRQNALIALMAQIGSFVPAAKATLPIVDRIFARVGASDMLISGISTFMMEMLEVATILKRATKRSLIILDEMGRGTNTFDGVSIAWAVARELATHVGAKTLFATHYQELTRLASEVPAIVNQHVAVKDLGKDLVFLHRVEAGVATGSYGVHVARLAGLPDRVTETADRILSELLEEAPLSRLGRSDPRAEVIPLFGTEDHPVLKALRKVDVNNLTPLEALEIIAQLKDRL
ncbi:MAG: DNA mismatch repair protein MutS [Candidatus Bipolaricaulota bacterium]|nr:DNA mismatch repair protein MutS [Candidatus Bipolaricaulota bacterium]